MKEKNTSRKPMKRSAFWLNILAMALVAVLALILTFRWLGSYTQHGQAILVPDVTQIDENEAIHLLETRNLNGISADRSFARGIPEGVVIDQRPKANAKVKRGHNVYLTISSGNEPMVKMPDLADNSSYRQAASRLRAAGFVLTKNDSISGQADWVYKILYNGVETHAGQMIPEGSTLTLVVGDGRIMEEEVEMPTEVEDDWF